MNKKEVNGREYSYQDVGEGYPLLFGHSFLWDSEMWRPQLDHLKEHFRCIAVDLWDHGHSDHLGKESTTIEELADDAWQLMSHLGISQFGCVGLSVGGMWGTQLALDHPEAVSTLVLMDTYVGGEPEVTQKKYFGMLDLIEKEKGFSPQMLDQVVPLFFSSYTLKENPELVRNFRHKLASIPEENIPGIVTLGRAIFSRTSLLDRLPSLRMPALVVVGEDDIPRPPKEAEEMTSLLPNSQLEIIPQAGHICNLEQVEVVTQLLGKFMGRHILLGERALKI